MPIDLTTLLLIALSIMLVLGLAVLGYAFWSARDSEEEPDLTSYLTRKIRMTDDEKHAVEYLRRALGPEVHILPRVRISDVPCLHDLGHKKNWKEIYKDWFERNLDILVLDPNMRIHFALMFDKRTRQEPNFTAEIRDLNAFCKHADLNLMHVLAGKLERSDHLEFAATQTRLRPVIRKVA